MVIAFSCTCGKPVAVLEEMAGRRVRCRECGAEHTVPPRSGSPAHPAGSGTPGEPLAPPPGYVYKMVQIPPVIEIGGGGSAGQEAAAYLQRVVNAHAGQGWEFCRVDPIGVRTRVSPGCLGVFLGERETVTTTEYYVITFRRPGNTAIETVPDPVKAVKDAGREREEVADREAKAQKEAADRDLKARMEAAARRDQARSEAAERRAARAAWFNALPDGLQLLLILAVVVLPIGIVVGLVILFARHP